VSAPFRGKTAVVTGAGGDVGGAAALLLAQRGAAVLGVDINPDGLRRVEAQLPAGAAFRAVVADVSDESAVERYVAAAVDGFGGIDLFFNNAGIEGSRTGAWCAIPDLALEDFEQIMAVNVTGVFLGLKHVIPVMAGRGGGAIVNTSSIYGLKGSRKQLAYVASKHAVKAMTATTAKEWATSGIRVNAIAPGAIEGRMLRDFVSIIESSEPPPDPEKPVRYNPPPISRWSDPREIAQMAIFLLSDEASYITGACYSVDGGLNVL